MADSNFESWQQLRKLGQGGFGQVWLVRTDQGHELAAKYIDVSQMPKAAIAQVERETAILKRLSHPNVVRFVAEKLSGNSMVVFTEFIDGSDLADLGRIGESVAKGYLRQICSGLHYLHLSQVLHKDIKGQNIMVTRDGAVKLIDFGISLNLIVASGYNVTDAVMPTANKPGGTLPFMAPELHIPGHAQFSVKSDVWALGITVYQMMAGRPPFIELGYYRAIVDRITGVGAPQLPAGCSNKLVDFYSKCTAMNPRDRPPVRELLQHLLFA